MDVLVLIDKLDDTIHNAKPVPLTDQVRVDKEAERILKEAREEQNHLIGEEEVVKQAERQADDIIEDARAREREIRLGAEDYADDILNTLEVNLTKFTAAVQRGRDRLQGREEAEIG
jgi:vacuolar-type H+-ATPase subunit H